MSRIVYLAVFVASALVLALGVLFLCAAITVPERAPLAIVLLVLGALGAGWSTFAYRRWSSVQPSALMAQITSLAADHDGELAVSQVMAGFGATEPAATAALAELAQKGQCRREARADQVVYVFPGLKEHKMVRKCAFCGSTFPVKQALQKCPNCGGALELVTQVT
jgi:Zn finger protein HypA/HybF involved in hydrogenase expression